MLSSGTEASMSGDSARARGDRPQAIVKFAGAITDTPTGLLVGAPAPARPRSCGAGPSGVPEKIASLTRVARYNDLASVKRCWRRAHRRDHRRAVAANMGVVPPAVGFLAGLRRIADRSGCVVDLR